MPEIEVPLPEASATEVKRKGRWRLVLKGVLASVLAVFWVYSVAGLFGGADVPMFRWSAWWYPSRLFPGASRDFEDHFLNVLLFGAWLLMWGLRLRRRRAHRQAGNV